MYANLKPIYPNLNVDPPPIVRLQQRNPLSEPAAAPMELLSTFCGMTADLLRLACDSLSQFNNIPLKPSEEPTNIVTQRVKDVFDRVKDEFEKSARQVNEEVQKPLRKFMDDKYYRVSASARHRIKRKHSEAFEIRQQKRSPGPAGLMGDHKRTSQSVVDPSERPS